jgi:hypothetical protein
MSQTDILLARIEFTPQLDGFVSIIHARLMNLTI